MAHTSPTKKRGQSTRERCCICKQVYEQVTAGHLRTHGYTVERYERLYGARRAAPHGFAPTAMSKFINTGTKDDDTRHRLVSEVAESITDDKVWLACIADEVGEAMLNGPLKQRLSVLLTTMLAQRAQVHGQSMAVLSSALGELQEDWRITQGGKNGGPTDSDTLMRMIEKASRLVRDSEEAVHRTMKLALDEQRQQAEYADALGPSLYAGTGEQLDMPAGMPTGDRETIRNLLSMIGKAANEHGTITVDAVPVEPVEVVEAPSDDRSPPAAVGGTPSPTPPSPPTPDVIDPCPAPRRRRRKRRISE